MTRVYASTVLDAPIEQVWHMLRDFNGHDRWHPAIATSQIEQGAGDAMGRSAVSDCKTARNCANNCCRSPTRPTSSATACCPHPCP